MNHKQMLEDRCPGSRFISLAKLIGYEFVYDGVSKTWGGSVANIVEKIDGAVWGGVFEVNDEHLRTLDKYEGIDRGIYNKVELPVRINDGEKVIAFVYCRKGQVVGVPSDQYRNVILKGADDCKLPSEYIHSNLSSQ